MADGNVANQIVQNFAIEHLRDQAHAFVDAEVFAIADDDPGALLSAMLQGIKAIVRQFCCVRMPVNAKNTAIMFRIILHGFSNRDWLDRLIMPQVGPRLKRKLLLSIM